MLLQPPCLRRKGRMLWVRRRGQRAPVRPARMSCHLSPSTGSSTAERPALGRSFTLYASHHCRRQAQPTQRSASGLGRGR
jgi:hypothetical protein